MSETPLRKAARLPWAGGAIALLLAAPLALAACSRSGGGAAPGTAAAPAAATVSGAGVVAEVNGAPILASELDQRAAGRLARLRQEEYEVRREVLDELVAERLVAAEAAKRKVSPEELLRLEVDAKAEALPAEQLELIYRQNAERFAGQPRDQALARIRSVLGDRAKAERRAAYQSELRNAARVAVRLDAPRVAIEIPPGAPSTGPADAPVTIVAFTDYQCPYCHRAQNAIDQVLARTRARSASSTWTSRSTAIPRRSPRLGPPAARASRGSSGSTTGAS